jgi:SAM-dependent methyltransferase
MPAVFSPFLQRLRFNTIQPFLVGDILDLGCGRAKITAYLQTDQRYVGVESTPQSMRYLRSHFPQHQFYMYDLDRDILEVPGQFDTILLVAVLEHLANPDNLMGQVPALLQPGGNLVITTPSPLGDRVHRLGARFNLFSRAAVEDHEIIYTPATLEQLLAHHHFKLARYRPFLMGGNQLFICNSI